jgi:hypothetical protein
MADFGLDGANLTLDWLTGKVVSPPAGLFLKLHIGDPGFDGTQNPAVNTERQSVALGAATSGVASTLADLLWTNVPATETYSHISIWDTVGPAGGQVIWQGSLTIPVAVTAGGDFTLPAGQTIRHL